MGNVDDATLVANSLARLARGCTPGNLLLDEEADHVHPLGRLHLLADHDAIRVALLEHERVVQLVVIRDADAVEADGERVLDEADRVRKTVEGCVRVNVQVYADTPARRSISRHASTARSEEHTSELQSRENLVCRLL